MPKPRPAKLEPITRRGALACLAGSAAWWLTEPALADSAAKKAAPKPKCYLQPMGAGLSAADVEFVKLSLLAFYEFELVVLPSVPLPRSAYYAPRKRYRAEKLLSFLKVRLPEDGFRILGITAKDISTTKGKIKDWGVIGLATIDGSVCVLSRFRTLRGAKNKDQANHRFGKVAVHEIGHTLGLEHCPTDRCLMQDARGSVTTTDREYDLCGEVCRTQLARAGFTLSQGAPPWPKP